MTQAGDPLDDPTAEGEGQAWHDSGVLRMQPSRDVILPDSRHDSIFMTAILLELYRLLRGERVLWQETGAETPPRDAPYSRAAALDTC